MSVSCRFRSLRSTGSIPFVFALLACAIAAASSAASAAQEPESRGPASAAAAAPAAAPEAAEDALRDAVRRFERLLRRRLTAADGPVPAGALDLDRLRRHLQGLRTAARRLEAADGGELERKVLALRPLLLDLERGTATPARRRSPSPWQPAAGEAAAPLAAAAHSTCAAALPVGDGLWHAGLGSTPGRSGEIWLRYTARSAGWASVTTAGSDFDTVVEVFAACPGAGGAPVARGDDQIGLQAAAAFRVAAGESRWIRLGGWRGAAGSLVVGLGGGLTGITGTVIEEVSGEPVTDDGVLIWGQNGSFEGSGLTNALGDYVVLGLQPGTYFVSTQQDSDSELLDELFDDLPCPGGVFNGGCDPTDGTPVVVTTGTITPEIDFALAPGAEVAGRVRDAATGEAVPFADVRVFDSNGGFDGVGFSDAAGRYRVTGLGSGVVFAVADGNFHSPQLYEGIPCVPSCVPTTGTPIPVMIGATTGGIDFDLDKRGALAGRLTATGGAPVPFERVEVFAADGSFAESGFADEQGNYHVGGLDAGPHFVATEIFEVFLDELYDDIPCEPFCDPTTGTPVVVVSGATTAGIDFELRRAGRITGRVTDAGTLAGVDAVIQVFDGAGDFVASGFGDSEGFYTIEGLTAGTYFVTASAFFHFGELYDDLPCRSGFPPDCDPTAGDPVQAQVDVTTAGVDFSLQRLGRIAGTVTDEVSGEPLVSRLVLAYDASGELVANDFTDGLGRYVFGTLDSGSHFLVATSFDHFDELYDDLPCPGGPPDGCDPTTGTAIPVVFGSPVTGIDFALAPKGAIEGTVIEVGSGSPVTFVQIAVWDVAGDLTTTTGTDHLGRYRAVDLDTGSYFVTVAPFSHAGELYDDLPCPGGGFGAGCDPTSGTAVAVVAGATTSAIDFELERLGRVSGRITEAETGTPLNGASAVLFDDSGAFLNSTSVFGADGRYVFEDVPAGNWFVGALNFGSHAGELYDDIPCPSLSCDPTTGTPVAVSNGAETAGIDFALDVASGIVGRVTDDLGDPVPGVAIDLWNPAGELIQSAASGPTGFYRLAPFDAGTYFVSTDNGQGLLDEIFDDVPCPLGPAFEGLCDPLDGDPVVLPSFDSLVEDVDFQLTGSPLIFADGFESGDVSAWSAALP